MNEYKKALNHAISWVVFHIDQNAKETAEIIKDDKLSESEKTNLISGKRGKDYNLVDYILLLKPLIKIAREEFPENDKFFEWIEDRWKVIEEKKIVNSSCGCKGCKEV